MVPARESPNSFQRRFPCVYGLPKPDRKVTDRKTSPDTSRGYKCYHGNMSVLVEHGGGVLTALSVPGQACLLLKLFMERRACQSRLAFPEESKGFSSPCFPSRMITPIPPPLLSLSPPVLLDSSAMPACSLGQKHTTSPKSVKAPLPPLTSFLHRSQDAVQLLSPLTSAHPND